MRISSTPLDEDEYEQVRHVNGGKGQLCDKKKQETVVVCTSGVEDAGEGLYTRCQLPFLIGFVCNAHCIVSFLGWL